MAQSQCGSILAKAAVPDQASLPDDMPSPCLRIHKTLGIYGDSWGRQGESLSSLCWDRYSNWPTDRDRLHNLPNTVLSRILLQLQQRLSSCICSTTPNIRQNGNWTRKIMLMANFLFFLIMVGQLILHLGPDQNISTTTMWQMQCKFVQIFRIHRDLGGLWNVYKNLVLS